MGQGASAAGPLPIDEARKFVSWLFIDLATRPAPRGRRQKEPLHGVFVGLCFAPKKRQLRGSDFSIRIALAVQALRRAGSSILGASMELGEDDHVKSWLGKGKRGRRCARPDAGTIIDETVRTHYYKFRQRQPRPEAVDQLLDGWLGIYRGWCDWVTSSDERTLDFVADEVYRKWGRSENATRFFGLAASVRDQGAGRKREWLEEKASVIAARLHSKRGTLGPEWVFVAADMVQLGRLHRRLGRPGEALPLFRRALGLWKRLGSQLPHQESKAIALLEGEIADLGGQQQAASGADL